LPQSCDPISPAITKKSFTGDVEVAISVGSIDPEALQKRMRRETHPRYSVYFTHKDEVAAFCHGMRGSKTNWIKDIQFYLLPSETLEALTAYEETSASWSVTIVDNEVYLTVHDKTFDFPLPALDMWAIYQDSVVKALEQ